MNDEPIFDFNNEERKFERGNTILSAVVIVLIVAIVALFLFWHGCANAQTIGDSQIGVQTIEVEFRNSYQTDTLVIVGQHVRLHFESPFLYDAPDRAELRIVREWPGVEYVIFEDRDAIGDFTGRTKDELIVVKLHIGYNQIVRLQYGGVLSRRYFLVALREVPNLDATENGEVTNGDKIYLGRALGSRWPQRDYEHRCDFNRDGLVDDVDVKIFEQAKYWR